MNRLSSQGWGLWLMALGAVVFLAHLAMYLIGRTDATPLFAYWIPRGVMFALLLGLLCCARPRALLPRDAAERPVWAIWMAYLLAMAAGYLVIHLEGRGNAEFYPFSAQLSGMGFFILGGHLWGGCYLIGLAFMAGAPLLVLNPDSSVLWFGTLWLGALGTLGIRYWRLGRRG